MKTNVTLKRHSIQGVEVLQRTSDGYFNITELTKAFNVYFGTNKRVDKFFDNQQTKDFITEIYKQEVLGNEPPKEGVHSLTTNEPPKEGVLNSSLDNTNGRVLNSSLDNTNGRVLNKDITAYSVMFGNKLSEAVIQSVIAKF